MRCPIVPAAFAFFATIAVCASPSLSMERLAKPSGASVLVTPIADLDRSPRYRKTRVIRHRHARHWQARAYANRWLHYQYVNAGYPVRHTHRDIYYTYLPSYHCCGYHRHW